MSAQVQTVITATEHNQSYSAALDVLGLGENGWGLPLIASNPRSSPQRIFAADWNNLVRDLNFANKHIYGADSAIAYAVTGTTVISASYVNSILDLATQISDDNVRYTCAASNFVLNPLTSSTTNYSDSVSLRTLPWGGNGVTSIKHTMVVSWPNRLSARYYFNEGNFLKYDPFYSGAGLNDLDTEWAAFINYLGKDSWKYGHTEFTNYRSTTTNWSSGTLEIIVSAYISADDKSIEVDVEYINNASADLILTPTVAIWNIT